MSKASDLRKLTQEHKKAQQVNADVADYFMQELTRRLQDGEIQRDDFVAAAIVANRLSRDATVKLAGKYVSEARKLTAPKLVDLRPVEPKFDVLQSTIRASATVRAEEIRAKVAAEIDRRVAERQAWRTEVGSHLTPREKEILDKQKEKIRQTAGRWNRDAVKKDGRQVVIRSAESAGSGWRVVTDGKPCAFCAMLASYGEDVNGAESWPNHYFHPGCGCTIQEVPLGTEVEYTEQEKALIALREEAEKHGSTQEEITAYMREHGQGIVKDATVPEDERKKLGRPKTADAAGGGKKPPNKSTAGGVFGGFPPNGGGRSGDFWEADPDDGDLPNDYIPPSHGYSMPFTRETRPRANYERAQHVLARHASDAKIEHDGQTFFPADFDEIEAIKYAIDRVTYLAEPQREGMKLTFEANIQDVLCHVVVNQDHGEWVVKTIWPVRGRGVTIARGGKKIPLE